MAEISGTGLENIQTCAVCDKGLTETDLIGSMKSNYLKYKNSLSIRRIKLEEEWEGRSSKKSDDQIIVAATCGQLFHKSCLMSFCSTSYTLKKGSAIKKPRCPKCEQQIMYSMHREIDIESHRMKGPTLFEKRFLKTKRLNEKLLAQHTKQFQVLQHVSKTLDDAVDQLEKARDTRKDLSGKLPGSVDIMNTEIELMRRKKEEKLEMEKYIEKAERVIKLMQNETPNVMRMYLREVQSRPLEEIPQRTLIPRMLIPYLDKISQDESCLFSLSQVLRPRCYPGLTNVTNDSLLADILHKVSPSLHEKLITHSEEIKVRDIQSVYESLFPRNSLKVLESLREMRKSSEQSIPSSSSDGSDVAITIMYVLDDTDKPMEHPFLYDKTRPMNYPVTEERNVEPSFHFTAKKAPGFRFIASTDSTESVAAEEIDIEEFNQLQEITSEETVSEVLSDLFINSIETAGDGGQQISTRQNHFLTVDSDEKLSQGDEDVINFPEAKVTQHEELEGVKSEPLDESESSMASLSSKIWNPSSDNSLDIPSKSTLFSMLESVLSQSQPDTKSPESYSVLKPPSIPNKDDTRYNNKKEKEPSVLNTRSGNFLCTLFRENAKLPGEESLRDFLEVKENETKIESKGLREGVGMDTADLIKRFLKGSEGGDIAQGPSSRSFRSIPLPQTQSTLLSNAEMGGNGQMKLRSFREPQACRSIGAKFAMECETPSQRTKPITVRKCRRGISRRKTGAVESYEPSSFFMDPSLPTALGMQIAKLAMTLAPPLQATRSNPLRKAKEKIDCRRSNSMSMGSFKAASLQLELNALANSVTSKNLESRRSVDAKLGDASTDSKGKKPQRKRVADMARTLQRLLTPKRLPRTEDGAGAVPSFVIGRPPFEAPKKAQTSLKKYNLFSSTRRGKSKAE